ncbi:hypothetical protein DHEL01_v213087 [Diaporthe helianthi]|uniref:Uncharacterized protein n=1 Tax=Diaporthe helianthi TaxID=158607 RepID=A0A2P5HE61_DIAHE|nr:hypothetical protein DHEL01_v213087 [Diaporthe helianthi]
MSSFQGQSTSNNHTKQDPWNPKNLVNSRWAPGRLEDRIASTDGSAFGAQAFMAASRQACRDPAEIIQAGVGEANKHSIEANAKANNLSKNNPSSMELTQHSHQTAIKHENNLPPKITTTNKDKVKVETRFFKGPNLEAR